MRTLGNIGAPGMAFVLTLALFYGTKGGPKAKLKLTWTSAFWVGAFAGAAYQAAAVMPFTIVNDLIHDMIAFAFLAAPGLTTPAIALILATYLLFAEVTIRKVGVVTIILFYVAGASGGAWGTASTWIAGIMSRVAAGGAG
ncbi:hypothetical protein [Embleya sp. NPDC001921]